MTSVAEFLVHSHFTFPAGLAWLHFYAICAIFCTYAPGCGDVNTIIVPARRYRAGEATERTDMKLQLRAILPVASACFFLAAPQAFAHANLVSSDPAKDATIATPKQITLHFSEALEMKVSGLKLIGVDGKPVAIKSVPAPDAKSLAAVPVQPLAPGLYKISWTSMGDDAHKLSGTVSFSVK